MMVSEDRLTLGLGDVPVDDARDGGERDKSVLLTFQGGGAKGIVHVGALLAVEDQGLTAAGAAGTSAGAMVAALVAAGYSGRELMDPERRTHILSKLGPAMGIEKAIDLFGPVGWLGVKALRSSPVIAGSLVEIAVLVLVGLGLVDLFHPVVAMILLLALIAAGSFVTSKLSSGVTSVRRVRAFIDHALSEKLAAGPNPPIYRKRNVTFRDLHEAGKMPLHIVASNITEECGEVFSYERTPDVPVADAVAASICLPVIFEPWRFVCTRGAGMYRDVCERSFQDGGLISNLPVWTLQRNRDELQCPIVAFGIDQARIVAPNAKGPLASKATVAATQKEKHWLTAIGAAVVSGTLEIDARGVEDMVHVPIPCSLSLLDFDAGVSELFDNVKAAREFVYERLRLELTDYPEILQSICEQVRAGVIDVVSGAPWSRQGVTLSVKVTAAYQPRSGAGEFQLLDGAGFGAGYAIDVEDLTRVWEANDYLLDRHLADDEWKDDYWRMLVPVSHRVKVDELPVVNGKREKPFVVVVEFSDVFRPIESREEQGFEEFFDGLGDQVVGYTNGLVYDAVQRRSSSPWS
ncbi:patatin-like phospholipase family protein [Burkholderia cenocepacia]|uniref:patatin-like phospholipase family protein n=1 Tax=Burkholderia cenocepacia TaxID=95486 RepID=UPI0028620E1B|nr:patatin-like phospholipase family protein [Burkholderia cenocepacia]MDR5645489.1 patatin-like phospholipase family protein [Burkholderia cenocepacia]